MSNQIAIPTSQALTHRNISTLETWLSRLPANTARAYRKDIEDFATFLSSDVERVNEFAASELYKIGADYVNSMNGKSTATISRKVSAVRSYFDFLCEIGILKDNPLKHVRTPKIHNRKRDTLTSEDTTAIINAINRTTLTGKRDYALILLMAQLGMRRAEIANLRHGNLKQNATKRTFLEFNGKGEKERVLPLSQGALDALTEYFEKAGINSRSEVSAEYPVFPNHSGQPISENMVYLIVKKYADLANIDKEVSPHTFRHFAITEAVSVEPNIMKVKEFSGHASTNTLARYTHLNAIEAVETIQQKRGIN